MSDVIPLETQMKIMKKPIKMPDVIPLKIQVDIIKKTSDVNSLVRFRSVSQEWKTFIDSSKFIVGYGTRHTQLGSKLLRYEVSNKAEKYISFVDDNADSFTQQQEFVPTELMKQLNDAIVIGSSHGLLCLFGHDDIGREIFVIWNPLIRKSFGAVVTDYESGYTNFAFTVCPLTSDPVIVKISSCWQVEIFTLALRDG